MSRSDQWMGIPPEAIAFIGKYGLVSVGYDTMDMAFNDMPAPLHEWYYPGTEPDDEGITKHEPLLREVEQCTPWSSGPCYFIKLVDKYNRDVFYWGPEDIDNC